MKKAALICGLALGFHLSLEAGSVNVLDGTAQTDGKLSIDSKAIQAQSGSSSSDTNLADVLEADFWDTPFQLDFFLSKANPDQLPAGWQAQDIGGPEIAGAHAYKGGMLSLTGTGLDVGSQSDKLCFMGQPWNGDGQWTARIVEVKGEFERNDGGLMVRAGLDPADAQFSIGATGETDLRSHGRPDAKKYSETKNIPTKFQFPIWVRLTRQGSSIEASFSADGQEWEIVSQGTLKAPVGVVVGFYVTSRKGKTPTTVTSASFDQISFTPRPYTAQVVPSGALLLSGSLLATDFNSLDFDAGHPESNGRFRQNNGRSLTLSQSKLAAVVFHPTPRNQLENIGTQSGVLLKNGDFLAGDFLALSLREVRVSSVLLGIVSYTDDGLQACFLHPLQLQPSDYEVRLRDGSILRAQAFSSNKNDVTIQDVSGVSIETSLDDVAQVRAGLAKVQPLLDLAWKSTSLPTAAPRTPATPSAVTGTNAAPAAPAPPAQDKDKDAQAAAPPPEPPPSAQSWGGPNQEQILVLPGGTSVDFPLTGKFRSLAMKVAFSPDTPPNGQASLRILADGRELTRTPPFKAGDQPRFIQVGLPAAKVVTITADAVFPGTRVLLLDPVVVRGD